MERIDITDEIIELKFCSPFTEEEMSILDDYIIKHVDRMWFRGRDGKNVAFVRDGVVRKWIPCKDRLPEKAGRYFVQGINIPPNFHVVDWCADRGGWNIKTPVVAWMPLPDPYEWR